MLTLAALPSSPASPRGIVVVSVEKYSEAESAGLKPGDVLESWSQAEVKGLRSKEGTVKG